MQKLIQLPPLNPPPTATIIASESLQDVFLKEENKGDSIDLSVVPQSISPARDWLAKLKRQSGGTAKKYFGQVLRFEEWLAGRPIN